MAGQPTPRRIAQLFGASPGAAVAYDHMCRRGALTASQAAPLLGKSRSRTYEVLRELVAKGLAFEEPGRPARFHVGNVRDALATLKEDLAEQSNFVEQALKHAPTPRTKSESAAPRVSFFYGAHAMEKEAARIARRAMQELVVYCADGANRLPKSEPLRLALRKAIRRGVRVRAYALPSPDAANLLADLSVAPGKGFRGKVIEGLAPFSCIASETQALFPLPVPQTRGRGVHAMRTDSTEMAQFAIRTLDHLADEAEAEGQAVERMEDFVPKYAQALDWAQAEVSNIGGAGWSQFLRPPYYRIFQGHSERAATRGVKLRAIINDGPDDLQVLRRYGVSGDWEVRTASWIPVWTSVIDKKLVFQALLGPEGARLFRWSKSKAEVEFCSSLFEASWQAAMPLATKLSELSAAAPGIAKVVDLASIARPARDS